MNCMNCGKELPDGAKFCSECGAQLGVLPTKADAEPEMVIRKGSCNIKKNMFYTENGHATLTNKRFIFSKHSLTKIAMTGVLSALSDDDCEFSIPLSDIADVSETRLGMGVLLTTRDGKEYKLGLWDLEAWLEDLHKYVK